MPTAGHKRIPQQGHAYRAAEVVQQLAETGCRPNRAGVSLLGLAIDLHIVSIVMLVFGRLLHSRPLVNCLGWRKAAAKSVPPYDSLLSLASPHRARLCLQCSGFSACCSTQAEHNVQLQAHTGYWAAQLLRSRRILSKCDRAVGTRAYDRPQTGHDCRSMVLCSMWHVRRASSILLTIIVSSPHASGPSCSPLVEGTHDKSNVRANT